ncbi:hypothetical protein [Bradyrhizobium canariense]|uniref:hypothetical protein n=1 Tax=Bradyrhizobium canariense TaxID=255045 RepID=UPI0011BA944F|nr:hypothetical protein [Bradyrhizobium canariense]
MAEDAASPARGGIATFGRAHSRGLSNRALNVLKMLAAEITGECATREQWIPSTALLREMTFKHLLTARNCGPRTTAEIVQWAQSQGVTIQPLLYAGKSLSETWRDLSAKFTAGELTHAEIAAALEKSVRRKSTTIPIAVQKILLHLLNTANGKS